MKSLSTAKLAETVKAKRENLNLTQEELSSLTGINRVTIGRIEREDFIPSIRQLEALSNALDFDVMDVFTESQEDHSFIALKSEDLTDEEKEGVDKLFTMMLALRQQFLLRKKFENETNNAT
ncbi:MAG TPA: helix-turn-helix transcriptional regulator [Firmicutes bacterium]|nr:helix-turn-helix domain-containing protein [Bacillota bacterium]HHT41932.1 helix-turn-helix transcriptional regulator [Bacillota bacterium]